jgi:3-deoxy-D-manno-octulosonic-acid transferase
VAAVFNPKARLFLRGRKDIFNKIKNELQQDITGPLVWVHCASLGEFEQGRPVMEALKTNFPQYRLLLTFFSPSGYEAKKNYPYADHIFYLPLDSRRNAARFLDITTPLCALFVKYELWFHYLKALKERHIPTLLLSAYFQQNQVFFKKYGGLYRKMLSWYEQVFVQDENSKKLLETLGIRQVQVAGDTRFDRAAKALTENRRYPEIAAFKDGKKLIVAGSTWAEDESLLQRTFALLPPGYKLLIAPHEIKTENIRRIQNLFEGKSCLWDGGNEIPMDKEVCIVNCIGHLAFLYRYADIVWVGGGFTRSGIHNIIEPAVFGAPVFFGPNFKRFREAFDMLASGAAYSETAPQALAHKWKDEAALEKQGENAESYVLKQSGATVKIMEYLSATVLSQW